MDRTRFQQQQMTSGLTRYRSAPTSYFSTLMNSSAAADTGSITGGGGGGGGGGYARDDFDREAFGRLMASLDSQDLSSNEQNPKRNLNVKQESDAFEQPLKQKLQKVDLSSKGNIGNYSGQARNTHTSGATTSTTSAMDSSYGLMNSSNLTRYNTSPAGFFDQMDIQNEYGGEALFSSSSLRFKNHTSFSSGQPTSCSAPMDPISEIGDEGVKDEGGPRNHENYASPFSLPPWEDSDLLSDYFLNPPGEKSLLNPNTSDVQKGEDLSRPPGLLSHHLSLPKSSVQLSAIMQDSVPCKVRAKRGCATHPRSIAERVRRTRISERMRKLQELVPNMDKQTNTADMLDLAVDYIKGLESKVKVLSENRAKCKCSGK